MHYTTSARWDAEPMTTPNSIIRFYVRRFFRLAPVYYLAIAFVALASTYLLAGYLQLQALDPAHWSGQSTYDPSLTKYTLDNILWHASFLAGMHPTYSVRTYLPDWSLSLEAQFYFAFPALALLFRRFGPFGPSVVTAGLCFLLIPAFSGFAEPSVLPLRLPVFLAGMLLYEACVSESMTLRAAFIATAITICLYLSVDYGSSVLWLLSAIVLIPAVAIKDNPLFKRLAWARSLCRSQPVRILADASYSVYLFHGAVIAILGSWIASMLLARGYPAITIFVIVSIAVAVCTTIIAFAIFRLIERPFIVLGGKFLERKQLSALTQD